MNRRTSAVLAFVAAAVALSGFVPGAVVASHGDDSTDFTVDPGSPEPGASDVSYTLDSELTDNFGDSRSGFEDPTDVTFTLGAGNVTGCGGTLPGGVDQPYTLSVTGSDGSQQEFDEYEASFSGGTADFDISSSANDYKVGELLRLTLDGCAGNPSEAGWYQADLVVKGTAFGSDEVITLEATSHYYPICEGCDNESAAREELGPPPSEQTPTPTVTPTPTATPTPTEEPDPTPTAEPEPDPTPTEPSDEEPTPTPTPTEPSEEEPTPTPTQATTATDGGSQQQFFGMDPMIVVGVVAAISIGIAAFGATRL